MTLQTEFEFTLPKGYIDGEGNLHRHGIMRLANAKDEILPLEDPRVRRNEAYLLVILLSRVITKLGDLRDINPGVIEKLFAADGTGQKCPFIFTLRNASYSPRSPIHLTGGQFSNRKSVKQL